MGVPAKNITPLGGMSLLERAIVCADQVGGELVISTDYPQSMFRAPRRSVILNRPPRLAADNASMWDVLTDLGHKLQWTKEDTVVLLQPTSLHQDRAGIVKTILHDAIRPAVTVERFPDKWHPWYALCPECPNHPPPSRHGLPARFRPNGLAYIMSGCTAKKGTFWQDTPKFYEVEGVTNIDTPADWAEAERIYG